MHEFQIRTTTKVEMIDITDEVTETTRKSGVRSGLCTVFVPHTTAGITINENADPAVKTDMIKEINKIVPFDDHYSHGEGNAAAHIKSTLYSPSLTLVIEDGRLVLGTWQGIYLCEFDGPRYRKVYVKVIEG